MTDKKRYITRKLHLDEFSSVDSPAQKGAKALLMKRTTPLLAKVAFDDALTEMQLEQGIYEVCNQMWDLNEALRRSVEEIVQNKDKYPDPIRAIKESLQQFAGAIGSMVRSVSDDIEGKSIMQKMLVGPKDQHFVSHDFAYVPDSDKPSTWRLRLTSTPGGEPDPRIVSAAVAALGSGFKGHIEIPSIDKPQVIAKVKQAWLQINPDKTINDLPEVISKQEEADMTAKTIEGLEAELKIAKAYGNLTDLEKSAYSQMDTVGQQKFIEMGITDRQAELKKREESNPVVFKTRDGIEFRKSDDSRMVEMAKRAETAEAAALEGQAIAKTATLRKRAGDELGHLPGTEDVKVAVLGKLDEITDEDTRKGALEMLKASDNGLAEAFKKHGASGGQNADSPTAKLDVLAKRYMEDHKTDKVNYFQAYDIVTKTEEGKKLYEASLAS